MLGEARTGDKEAVSALAFNATSSMLLVGHANGSVVLWQWHRNVWEPVKTIRGRHSWCMHMYWKEAKGSVLELQRHQAW